MASTTVPSVPVPPEPTQLVREDVAPLSVGVMGAGLLVLVLLGSWLGKPNTSKNWREEAHLRYDREAGHVAVDNAHGACFEASYLGARDRYGRARRSYFACMELRLASR
jgi:hypothetical protein